MILCSENCVYQIDGICTLEHTAIPTAGALDICCYFLPKNQAPGERKFPLQEPPAINHPRQDPPSGKSMFF